MSSSNNSEWPLPDREVVLERMRRMEERLMARLETVEARIQALQSSELIQEGRLKALEDVGRTAGRHAGLTWGAAGSTFLGLLIWVLQQIQSGNTPWGGP